MKKSVIFALCSIVPFTTGCDYFKNKKEAQNGETTVQSSDWNCSSDNQLQQIKASLKQNYLRLLDRNIRENDYYTADEDILQKIKQGIRFEIKNIRTLNDDPNKDSQLNCESELNILMPKGLQKRAENAYLEYQKNCDEGCDGYRTLQDYLSDDYEGRQSLKLNNDQLSGKFYYNITKTDQEGIIAAPSDSEQLLDGLVFLTLKAVHYAAYIKENQDIEQSTADYEQESRAQTELAKKAMDIRQKELEADKMKASNKLSLVWNNLSEEDRVSVDSDQKQWAEKRDVDCQVIAQKNVYDLNDEQKETYQKHANYWNEAMRKQNQSMQYNKCFTQRTTERTVYLQNLFN